jgi:ribosomal protein S1
MSIQIEPSENQKGTEFARLFEESTRQAKVKEGEIIKGRIVRIGRDQEVACFRGNQLDGVLAQTTGDVEHVLSCRQVHVTRDRDSGIASIHDRERHGRVAVLVFLEDG